MLYRIAGASAIDVDPNLDRDAQALAVGQAMMASEDGPDGIEDMAEALVLAVVSDWSFGAVTPDVLDTVPDAAVQAIYDACQVGGYVEKLMPSFGPSPDEESPTSPS